VDNNNIPFLINGDTAWSLIVGISDSDVDKYIENRRSKGFNAIVVNLIEHYFGGPANFHGIQPFTTPGDFSSPNESYFAHADWVITKAAEKGMLVVLTPAYLGFECGEQGWCQELIANGIEKCRNYGRYLGNRYKDFTNIMWMHGGDAAAGEAIEEVRAIVEGIKQFDTVHLHTAHCSRQKSALDCYDETWLQVNTTYSNCEMTAAKIQADYNRARQMPFFYVEGTYEGEGAHAQCIRSQAYWSILGGAAGHFFGNHPIWSFGQGWENSMESEGARSMSYLAALFKSRAWYDLVPDLSHTVVVSGYGKINTGNYAAVAQTKDGNTVMMYMPTPRQVAVNLSPIAGTRTQAWWFDPASGHTSLVGDFPFSGFVDFRPKEHGDWVLVLENADGNIPYTMQQPD
jgi:hypothetical protein